MPTETVYGLAASIRNEEALKRIFSIKERPFFDPLIVHISDLEQKGQVVREWPDSAEILAKHFWPGPLTMVLPKQGHINPLISSGLDTVGLRMPSHPMARALIRAVGTPLAAPSANKFGKTSPTKAEHVRKAFSEEEVHILDGGPSEVGLESTVVALQDEGGKSKITILRPGAITQEMMAECFSGEHREVSFERKSSLASPGNTEHHYMPSIPLVILATYKSLTREAEKKIVEDFQIPLSGRGVELKLDLNPKLAARALYARMRECGESGADYIFVIRKAEYAGGMWDAIWDRLQRAASRVY